MSITLSGLKITIYFVFKNQSNTHANTWEARGNTSIAASFWVQNTDHILETGRGTKESVRCDLFFSCIQLVWAQLLKYGCYFFFFTYFILYMLIRYRQQTKSLKKHLGIPTCHFKNQSFTDWLHRCSTHWLILMWWSWLGYFSLVIGDGVFGQFIWKKSKGFSH